MPASMPATMSVSIRSPIMTADSECAPAVFSASPHHQRVGLADEVRRPRPVALVISAATEPVAGSTPSVDGPVSSGLVQMNRAPALIRRIAW